MTYVQMMGSGRATAWPEWILFFGLFDRLAFCVHDGGLDVATRGQPQLQRPATTGAGLVNRRLRHVDDEGLLTVRAGKSTKHGFLSIYVSDRGMVPPNLGDEHTDYIGQVDVELGYFSLDVFNRQSEHGPGLTALALAGGRGGAPAR